MTAYSTNGVKIQLITGEATPINLSPTAISLAKPAVVTVADTSALLAGMTVKAGNVGYEELNNRLFVIGEVLDGTTFTLYGTDLTNTSGALSASPTMMAYDTGDEVTLCLTGIDIGASSVSTIDTSTFCERGTSIPGTETLGSLTLDGFADKNSAGLAELVKANEDGAARMLKIVLPQDQGYLVGEVILSGLSFGIPLEGAITYSLQGTQISKIRWINDIM